MGRLEVLRYSAEYWRDRAEEVRAIRDSMSSNEARRIMTAIARDYDRLYDLTLKQSGPLNRQRAIDALMSSPFSAVKRDREPKE
jgi:hypothetical protein